VNQEWLIAIVIGLALGALIAWRLAADSLKKRPLHGGRPAQIAHYLACLAVSASTPFILTGLIAGLPFVQIFGTALALVLSGAALVILTAALERPAVKA
jgi:hypothetical protein